MCQFPRKDLLREIYFPEEMEEGIQYYISESSIVVDKDEEVYIKKNASLKLSPARQWERSHLLMLSHGGIQLSLTVPSNWRMERMYISDYTQYLSVSSLLITQTEEIEEAY